MDKVVEKGNALSGLVSRPKKYNGGRRTN